MRSSPKERWIANQRDAIALLGFIREHIERDPTDDVTWGHVGSIAHVRERLMEIAVCIALGPGGDEKEVRKRIEEAL